MKDHGNDEDNSQEKEHQRHGWRQAMAAQQQEQQQTARRQDNGPDGNKNKDKAMDIVMDTEPHFNNEMIMNDGSNNQGRMTMMGMTEILPATGTLDRNTSQASPAGACLYNNHQKTLDD
jgi:hypothetical protein